MKNGDPDTNGSHLDNDNIIKHTLDHLSEEDRKTLETYHEVDKIFLLRHKVTRQGLIQKYAASINIRKSEVTPEVQSNLSLSIDDVQVMINFALDRQAKSINELKRRLIEERNDKKLLDSNVHASSYFCAINFAQTNHQSSDTLASGTSQSNPSAQLMNHFYTVEPPLMVPLFLMGCHIRLRPECSGKGTRMQHLAFQYKILVRPYTLSGVTAGCT
jgi:hypothetical protein